MIFVEKWLVPIERLLLLPFDPCFFVMRECLDHFNSLALADVAPRSDVGLRANVA